jgi:hypothetical protein
MSKQSFPWLKSQEKGVNFSHTKKIKTQMHNVQKPLTPCMKGEPRSPSFASLGRKVKNNLNLQLINNLGFTLSNQRG